MNYCSLEDAWGTNFSESRKVKKPKRLYTLKNNPNIYDTSMANTRDKHCNVQEQKTFTVKNKDRYKKSRGHHNIYKPKNKRVDNINISYDKAKKEYKRYKKESKKMMKNNQNSYDLIENEIDNDNYYNNYSEIDSDNYQDLESLPVGRDMSNEYDIYNTNQVRQEMYNLQEKQNNEINRKQDLLQNQISNNNSNQQNNYNYDSIEGFENNNINDLELQENSNQEANTVNDIDSQTESDSDNESIIQENTENQDNNVRNKSNNKVNKNTKQNLLDKLLKNQDEEEVNNLDINDDNINYRLNTLNRNVNLIIKKLNDSNFFEEESQENIHDIILFILFGIFILFILDTIYKIGTSKNNSNNN